MASTTPKRSAQDEIPVTSKRFKTDTGAEPVKKSCILCCVTNTTFPAVSGNCKGRHTNDVCKLCWTKYINVKLFANPSGATKCVQCPVEIPYDYVRKITGDKNYTHYDFLVRRARAEAEGKRECLGDFIDSAQNKVTCHSFQSHDEEIDGRIFDCKKCGNRECVRCGVREHDGETCEAFQARLRVEHGHHEALTVAAFEKGYVGKERVGKGENEKEKLKLPKPCPACGVLIEREDKCPHMTCVKCANQFCIRCNAPYFGEGSVPQLGNNAHQPDCTYFKREKEDRRFARRVKGPGEEKGSQKKKGREIETNEDAAEDAAEDVTLAQKAKRSSAKKVVAS